MDDDESLSAKEPWFLPKRYGYGAGLPIAWQGWAIIGGYAATVIILAMLAASLDNQHSPLVAVPVAVIIMATIWLMWICARHTRGGWRWRWGGDD